MTIDLFIYEICSKEISKELHDYLFKNQNAKIYLRYFKKDFLKGLEKTIISKETYKENVNKSFKDIFIKLSYKEEIQPFKENFNTDDKSVNVEYIHYNHVLKVENVFENTILLPNSCKIITLYSCIASSIGIQHKDQELMISKSGNQHMFVNQPFSFFRSNDEIINSFDDKMTVIYNTTNTNVKENFLYNFIIRKYSNTLKRKINMIIVDKRCVNNYPKKRLGESNMNNLKKSFSNFEKNSLYEILYDIPVVTIYDENTEMSLDFKGSEIMFSKNDVINYFSYFYGNIKEFRVIKNG